MERLMRVLVVTNMWPSAGRPHWGAFVKSQVSSITDAGVEVVMHEIEGWRRSSEYLRSLLALPGIAKRSGAELVHAHYGLSGAAALRVPLPLVVSFCGDDLLGRPDDAGRLSAKSRALVGLSLFAADRAAGIIVKSEEMRRVLPARAEVNVIPNGVNLQRFAPRPVAEARAGMSWRADGQVLLFAANPDEPRKNFRLAREVESRLRAAGRDVRLEVCYGVPQERIALAMSAADVLLLPSFHEGSPNTVKEALACNLPVVAAPVGDCEERLRGCTPSAVAERTPEAFTAATALVLDARSRSNGRDVVAPLSLPAVAQRVIAVYERALARRKVA
jgi:glycosyltransferase involved in cell wall biosynthesis